MFLSTSGFYSAEQLPQLEDGQCFFVDENGAYLIDENGALLFSDDTYVANRLGEILATNSGEQLVV